MAILNDYVQNAQNTQNTQNRNNKLQKNSHSQMGVAEYYIKEL